MKKLIFILTFFALAAFTSPPVATTIYSGDKITSSGSTEVELQFADLKIGEKAIVTISVLSDSVRFSSGRTITNAKGAYAAGDKLIITITNGVTNAGSNGTGNLRYKANSSSDSFIVTH